ncbi:unnamed protein product [Rodentolepis nana]|uniref:Cystatin domain-containing protein n=1 Tax=Rodentolepis nana TaxID=102285 RepID=A0A0R3T3P5_RODNA|nr:unnamed protein product [Rodentolepis nana]
MRIFKGFIFAIFLLIGIRCSPVDGPRSLTRDNLESQEIRELVKSALRSSSPCFELVNIKSGTVHIENGIKYQFQLLTAPKPSCNATYYGNHISNLTVHLPASRFARPVFAIG